MSNAIHNESRLPVPQPSDETSRVDTAPGFVHNEALDGRRPTEEELESAVALIGTFGFAQARSEDSCEGMARKAATGIWPARAPLGYLNVAKPDGRRVVEPDPVRGPLVARLFAWYATGNYSLSQLSVKGAESGLVTRVSEKPLPSSLVHILTSRIYMGEFSWRGVLSHGVHQPLVSRELWEDVQAILTRRGPSAGKSHV